MILFIFRGLGFAIVKVKEQTNANNRKMYFDSDLKAFQLLAK